MRYICNNCGEIFDEDEAYRKSYTEHHYIWKDGSNYDEETYTDFCPECHSDDLSEYDYFDSEEEEEEE